MIKHFNLSATKELLHDSKSYYIICTDNTGNYSYINNHYAHSFKHIHTNLVGQPYYITMHPNDTKVCEEAGGKCYVHPGKLFPAIIRKHDGQGGYIITKWEFTLIVENYEPQGVFCLGYDITDYEYTKEKMQMAINDLEVKKGLLEQIAFEQSHIVRAPLASMMGLVNLLKEMDHADHVLEIIDMIDTSSKQLDSVIRDIVKKTYNS